ncbi:MAG: FAD-binding protein, partial [Acidimicrobiales bacterium]
SGQRFVDELAPRDVVSRAMAERLADARVEHLWLDATGLESFDQRFPTLSASLLAAGLDPAVDWLPIAPAAHYLSGGVVTDLRGASALPGLWVAGEAACTGVHGANRLASNSLLEGMVFGARLAEAIASGVEGPEPTGVMRAVMEGSAPDDIGVRWSAPPHSSAGGGAGVDVVKWRERLQRAMTDGAGVLRSQSSLQSAAATVDELRAVAVGEEGRATGELANLAVVARALLGAAMERRETRGAHARVEYPDPDPAWRARIVHGQQVRP